MSATPTISPDAAGITDTATARTGSVVDKLIAPDVAATADTIVHVPVRFVVPHPRNRKILDDDVADLVAEFKAGVPILNPLGVTAAADWNANRPADLKDIGPLEFIITAGGHRRLRAAELAGLEHVPCIVRADFAGAEGRKAALLENLHRQDLDPFEEAEAFAELVGDPYKLSQRDLAAIVGVNQSHISKRLKLLKLPSTLRESVRVGKTTIADAVALAGVVDNKPVFDQALKYLQQWGFDGKRAVARAQSEYDEQAARRKAEKELADAGVKVVDRSPAYGLYSKSEPVRLSATGIRADRHAKESCHAGHIGYDQKIAYVCTSPKRHLPDGESKVKLSKKAQEELARYASSSTSASDAEQRRQRRELKKVQDVRLEAASRIVRGLHDLSDDTLRELTRRGLVGQTFHSYTGKADIWKLLVQLVGVLEGGTGYPQREETDKLAKVPHDWILLALAVAYFESRVRASNTRWDDEERYYLNLLAGTGYEISDVEHEKLGDKRSSAGEWIPPTAEEIAAQRAEEDGPPCRVCGKHAAELEVGVTWVDEDLCSACADATDAGWLDDDSTQAAAAAGDESLEAVAG